MKKESVSRLKVEGKIYEDAQDMAEVMNNSFRLVFTVEGEFDAGSNKLVRNILSTVPVSYEEILKMMEELEVNKATGPDGVSNWILKECREQLADKIHSQVVTSLSQGRVPKDWKRANITPIYKRGNKENLLNYKPVSLTSVVGKLCKRTIKKRWMEHLERDKVLVNCQFGFRRGRSCSFIQG